MNEEWFFIDMNQSRILRVPGSHCDHALGIPESDGTFTFKTRVKKHPNTSVLQYLW